MLTKCYHKNIIFCFVFVNLCSARIGLVPTFLTAILSQTGFGKS